MNYEQACEEIESILGHGPDFVDHEKDGQKGFIPLYFNYNISSGRLLELFAPTKEECALKFLDLLKAKKGEYDAETGDSGLGPDDQED